MFVVTPLTHLALGQVTSMAQRWCAIPEPDTSADIVGGHDVVKRGKNAIDVFVLWFQLLKWEEQSAPVPTATSRCARRRVAQRRVRAPLACVHHEIRQLCSA